MEIAIVICFTYLHFQEKKFVLQFNAILYTWYSLHLRTFSDPDL